MRHASCTKLCKRCGTGTSDMTHFPGASCPTYAPAAYQNLDALTYPPSGTHGLPCIVRLPWAHPSVVSTA